MSIAKIFNSVEKSEFLSYIPFEKFITRLSLESTNIAQLQILLLLLTPIQI